MEHYHETESTSKYNDALELYNTELKDNEIKEETAKIAEILLASLRKRLAVIGVKLEISPAAMDLIIDKGYDENYGARPIKRYVSRNIETQIAENIIEDKIKAGSHIIIDIDKDKAEKLAQELELLEGLKLSVSHCEEVMNANVDRYPILVHTDKILRENIANIESDIASLNVSTKEGTGTITVGIRILNMNKYFSI